MYEMFAGKQKGLGIYEARCVCGIGGRDMQRQSWRRDVGPQNK